VYTETAIKEGLNALNGTAYGTVQYRTHEGEYNQFKIDTYVHNSYSTI